MTWRSRLWFTGVVWVLPITVVLGVWYVESAFPRSYGQPVSSVVGASEATALTFPFLAVATSWVAVRLRSAGWYSQPHTRRPGVLAVEVLTPLFLAGVFSYVVTAVYAMRRDHTLGWPGLQVPLVYGSLMLATCAWGYALGRWLRGWLAAPLALVTTFAVLGFPPALNPIWLRHLFGVSGLCCAIDKSVNSHVVLASTLVALGSTVLACAVASAAPAGHAGSATVSRTARVGLALAAQVAVVAVAIGQVSGLEAEPVQTRTTALQCRPLSITSTGGAGGAGGTVTACVWPEHVAAVDQYKQEIAAVAAINRTLASPPVATFSEGVRSTPSQNTSRGPARDATQNAAQQSPTAPMRFEPALSAQDRAVLVADSLSSQPDACFTAAANEADGGGSSGSGGNASGSFTGDETFSVSLTLRQWWRDQLGSHLHINLPPPPGIEVDPLARAAVAKLKSQTFAQQGTWIRAVTESRHQCGRNFLPGDA